MKAIGRHIILEMWRCSGLSLNSLDTAEQALRDMVAALDVNLLDLKVYPFSPVGVTGIAIVSESHLVIHTWPEYGYAAVDIFTCGAPRDPQDAIDVLRHGRRALAAAAPPPPAPGPPPKERAHAGAAGTVA